MKGKSEVIKQLVISEELEVSLVKKSSGQEVFVMVVESKEWKKEIPLAPTLGPAALSFVKLSDKFKTKYQQAGLEKLKQTINNVENSNLNQEQTALLYEILSGGKSRIIN